MQQLPSSTEDIFVREMILHGKKELAVRMAFPRMLPECIPAAIEYMMQDPDVRRRIDAGIVHFYRDFFEGLNFPEPEEVPVSKRKELLEQIILRKRMHPEYIRTEDGLRMIMVRPTAEQITDAVFAVNSLH
jgi:hypothetical protein